MVAIENPRLIDQLWRNYNFIRKLPQQFGNNMSPCFLPQVKVQYLYRLFRSLLSCKARPFMPSKPFGVGRLLYVPFGLPKPIESTVRHFCSLLSSAIL
jgi:hypothetical protein